VSVVDVRVIMVRAFLDAHRRGEIEADAITDEHPPWSCFSIERRWSAEAPAMLAPDDARERRLTWHLTTAPPR